MRLNPIVTMLILCFALVIMFCVSLTQGAVKLPAMQSLWVLFDCVFGTNQSSLEDFEKTIVTDLRLPRTLLAIFIGAILAQCGVVMQGLFRNPLADPGIIGVSSGAAVGAVVAIVILPEAWSVWSIPFFAFTGAILTTLVIYHLAKTELGTSVFILLLGGVAITAFSGAAIGLMSYFADNHSLRQLSLWQMGTLTNVSIEHVFITAGVFMVLVYLLQKRALSLNALLLGEPEARHLGVDVERLKIHLIIFTAIGVGIAVSAAGVIGFVGLVIPHLIRLITSPNHSSLLPLSAVLGAVVLLLSDVVARLLVIPAEIPVGIVTALLGAPFFLALLVQQRKNWR